MANDIRGEVEFEALGKSWTMKMGNGAVRSVESDMGKPFPVVAKELSDEASAKITTFSLIFRAGLRRHHPDVTEDEVDDIIDEIGQESAVGIVRKSFENMQPKKKGGAAGPRKATTG